MLVFIALCKKQYLSFFISTNSGYILIAKSPQSPLGLKRKSEPFVHYRCFHITVFWLPLLGVALFHFHYTFERIKTRISRKQNNTISTKKSPANMACVNIVVTKKFENVVQGIFKPHNLSIKYPIIILM